MNKKVVIITAAGIVIGTMEALIYYNMGGQKEGEPFKYRMPPLGELAATVGVVAVTSILTAYATQGIEMVLDRYGTETAPA